MSVRLKSSIAALLALAIAVFFGGVVMASPEPDEQWGGREVLYGASSITIQDDTGLPFLGDITVRIVDAGSGIGSVSLFPYERYASGKPIAMTFVAGTTYAVGFDFGEMEGFAIVDKNGIAFDSFQVPDDGYNEIWHIVCAVPASEPVSSDTLSNQADGYTATPGGDEEAARLFAEFLAATEHINESNLNLLYSSSIVPRYAAFFASITGREESEWGMLDAYERFLWYGTYLWPLEMLQSNAYDYYFGSLQGFYQNGLIGVIKSMPQIRGNETDAYKALMAWQYEYIRTNGTVYNFMLGKDYLALKKEAKAVDPERERADREAVQQAELEAIRDTVLEMTQEEEVPLSPATAAQGAWGRTFDRLRGMGFTLALLLAFSGALVGVVVYRKSRDIKEVEK